MNLLSLEKRETLGNLRSLGLTESLIDFASNDYLGLARSERLYSAVLQEWQNINNPLNGYGSTGSRLLTGNSEYAQNLENHIAAFHGYESGLLFNCGYMANVGLLSAIAKDTDTILYDSHIHASTQDGIRLSRASAFPFRHNDLNHLEYRLKNIQLNGKRFICVESIYSTDGSVAPLKNICELAQKYDANVIVDEAHAIGVVGPQGRGLVAEYNLANQVFAQVNTFGKALGTFGSIVLGNHNLKQHLVNFATSFIYTTALPLQCLIAIKCSYDIFPELDWERSKIQQWIDLFKKINLSTSSSTHIQPIYIPGNEAVQLAAENLQKNGFDVRALKSPTVKRGQESLRICLHSFNTKLEIQNLIENLCHKN